MPPNETEKKENRIIIPMSDKLLELIDDFRFANRCESRAEAVRQLIERGMALAPVDAPNKVQK